jgi:hypothetical protein
MGEMVFLFTQRPVLADEPGLLAGKMLLTLNVVSNLSLVPSRQPTFFHRRQQACFGRSRQDIRNAPLARTTPIGDRLDQTPTGYTLRWRGIPWQARALRAPDGTAR